MNPQGNERLKGLELLSVVLAQSSGTLLAKLKLVKERGTKAKEEGFEENAAFPIIPPLFHLLPKALTRYTLTFSDYRDVFITFSFLGIAVHDLFLFSDFSGTISSEIQ